MASRILNVILMSIKQGNPNTILVTVQSYKIIHHQSVLPKGKSFTANPDTKVAVPPKGRSSTANSGIKVVVLLGMNKCGSFPLLCAPHSLFSIWTHHKRSENIPGAPTWKRGDLTWLTGPSGHHRKSP